MLYLLLYWKCRSYNMYALYKIGNFLYRKLEKGGIQLTLQQEGYNLKWSHLGFFNKDVILCHWNWNGRIHAIQLWNGYWSHRCNFLWEIWNLVYFDERSLRKLKGLQLPRRQEHLINVHSQSRVSFPQSSLTA